jgi:hypothetical protein
MEVNGHFEGRGGRVVAACEAGFGFMLLKTPLFNGAVDEISRYEITPTTAIIKKSGSFIILEWHKQANKSN